MPKVFKDSRTMSEKFNEILKLKFKDDIAHASLDPNRPFSYSAKEPGSSVIFIHFDTRDSIEWR